MIVRSRTRMTARRLTRRPRCESQSTMQKLGRKIFRPLGRKIFRPNRIITQPSYPSRNSPTPSPPPHAALRLWEGETREWVWAGGEAARPHPSFHLSLLSPLCGESKGQGDERGCPVKGERFFARTTMAKQTSPVTFRWRKRLLHTYLEPLSQDERDQSGHQRRCRNRR